MKSFKGTRSIQFCVFQARNALQYYIWVLKKEYETKKTQGFASF
jgi:hypothetical protein